tara:strand:+ start:10493 stop:11047 length:555 start_codon:yes stop_codon:yes gene_type:complete
MKILNIPGNIGALRNWLSQFSHVDLIDPHQLNQLGRQDTLVLPGGNVGGLTADLSISIRSAIERECRLIAICGSFQSLFIDTEEDNHHRCLRFFSGHTLKLNTPRIGCIKVDTTWFSGSPYFNHSYAVTIKDTETPNVMSGHFAIDETGFCWAVKTDQILGVQFHPELSNKTFDAVFSKWLGAN